MTVVRQTFPRSQFHEILAGERNSRVAMATAEASSACGFISKQPEPHIVQRHQQLQLQLCGLGVCWRDSKCDCTFAAACTS